MTAALVMAGGRSERMRATGDSRHKALRCVAGRPLISWNLQALRHFGFSEIYLAVNSGEHELIDYAQHCEGLYLLVETSPLGTIGAVRQLPQSLNDTVVVNSDNLTDINLTELAEFHLSEAAAMTIATHEEPFQIPFGRLNFEGTRVLGYEEKPRIRVPISSGTYVIGRRAIQLIDLGERVDIPQLVSRLLAVEQPVRAWAHSARWIDVNDETALRRAECLVAEAGSQWPGQSLLVKSRA